jgi:hypothetical protein
MGIGFVSDGSVNLSFLSFCVKVCRAGGAGIWVRRDVYVANTLVGADRLVAQHADVAAVHKWLHGQFYVRTATRTRRWVW